MIISHKHKFIFIKTRKTAGTSIQIYLSRQCGKEDIISNIWENDRKHRRKQAHWHAPQNCDDFHEHAIASDIKQSLECFDDYYKFSVIRNPWDMAVSRYFWQKRLGRTKRMKRKMSSFDTYLTNYGVSDDDLLLPFVSIDGEVITDRIIRYENLLEDLELVCKDLGIEFDPSYMVDAKSKYRPKDIPYQSYYSEELKNIVAEAHKDDILYFGYEF
jgi:hypothetical protein